MTSGGKVTKTTLDCHIVGVHRVKMSMHTLAFIDLAPTSLYKEMVVWITPRKLG